MFFKFYFPSSFCSTHVYENMLFLLLCCKLCDGKNIGLIGALLYICLLPKIECGTG